MSGYRPSGARQPDTVKNKIGEIAYGPDSKKCNTELPREKARSYAEKMGRYRPPGCRQPGGRQPDADKDKDKDKVREIDKPRRGEIGHELEPSIGRPVVIPPPPESSMKASRQSPDPKLRHFLSVLFLRVFPPCTSVLFWG